MKSKSEGPFLTDVKELRRRAPRLAKLEDELRDSSGMN